MRIALLAVLGVDLIVIVVLVLMLVLTRRRWVRRQPDALPGAIRVTRGEIDGLPSKWKRGYGRWVSRRLVWTRAPFSFRNELVPVDLLTGDRTPGPGEVRRLGDEPSISEFESDAARVAARARDRSLVTANATHDTSRLPARPAVGSVS